MSALVVDASVWVAAADSSDRFWELSRSFLTVAAERNIAVSIPAFAEVEVTCALARRVRDAQTGKMLGSGILKSLARKVHATDAVLIKGAVAIGADLFLRAGDALYAALADRVGGQIVTWDNELVSRANAVTPEEWLAGLGSE